MAMGNAAGSPKISASNLTSEISVMTLLSSFVEQLYVGKCRAVVAKRDQILSTQIDVFEHATRQPFLRHRP